MTGYKRTKQDITTQHTAALQACDHPHNIQMVQFGALALNTALYDGSGQINSEYDTTAKFRLRHNSK